MILMTGEYDNYGKLCTRVMTEKRAFLVDRIPKQVLDDSLKYIGFDLKGAITGAKSLLDIKSMCPIIVNPYQKVSLFPTKSPKQADCIWFNPEHIYKTKAIDTMTEVYFTNGYSITVDVRRSSFIAKMENARRLVQISAERGMHPGFKSLYLEPRKEHRRLTKGKSGKYNFHIFEDPDDEDDQQSNSSLKL